MSEFYAFALEFASEHWFLTWCALWLIWGAVWLVAVAILAVRFVINRILRTIKVSIRGWPPSHLDADGDWKPLPKPEAQP